MTADVPMPSPTSNQVRALGLAHPSSQVIERVERALEGLLPRLSPACTAKAALDLLLQDQPELALVGGRFDNGTSGLSILQSAAAIVPNLRIALLVSRASPFVAEKALEAGAVGLIDLSLGNDELHRAGQRLVSGRTYLPPAITRALAPPVELAALRLDHRENLVLDAIAHGRRSTRRMAAELDLSPRQVNTTLHALRLSLGLESWAELVLLADQVSTSASTSAMAAADS